MKPLSSLFQSKRRVIIAAAVVLLSLFLLRPGASQLKSRIALSISAALSRQVEIGSVHIRLLPRPGFDLENVVIYDDPAFGEEPMLRAAEVTAVLRLTSLPRGRIEIARLDLTEPSINIVHGDNGHWNLMALVERTSRTPLAPTGKAKLEPRPGFPYIEATSARINFKSGREKKPYALTNADFALWQDSENSWGVRLKAQPFRSDLNLSDLGMLRVNGTWQRASTLRETPLQFSFEWDRPQLGQLTKFLTGADKGWRGAIQFEVTASGTPLKLQVSSDASVRDFRRYDIASNEPQQFAAHCDGHYTSLDHELHEIQCQAPIGNDLITLQGDMGLPGSHFYALTLATEALPAGALVALAQRVKKNLPDDLTATGNMRGSFSIRQNGVASGTAQFEGRGQLTSLRLTSARNKADLNPGTVSFEFGPRALANGAAERNAREAAFSNELSLIFDPFPVPLGRSIPATARASISRSGYRVSLAGDSEIMHALRLARLFGVPAISTTAEGGAQLDLQIAGRWTAPMSDNSSGFSPGQITGTVHLRNVRAETRGLDGPIEIPSANLQFLPNEVKVSKLTANAAHAMWNGSLDLPRGCGTPSACLISFNLNVNQLSLGELSQWVNPPQKQRPWYRLLASAPQNAPSFLAGLHASGKLTANRFLIRNLAANHLAAKVSLDKGKLAISDLRGDWLGGQHRGDWTADFSVKPPVYTGGGTLNGISLAQLAGAMKDDWITGTANGTYRLTATGSSSAEFWQSIEGTLQFDMRDGALPHISLANDAGMLRVDRFQGHSRLHADNIEINDGLLYSGDGTFLVSGKASLKRELDFTLTRSGEAAEEVDDHSPLRTYSITGTVTEPRVAPVSNAETQAKLKP